VFSEQVLFHSQFCQFKQTCKALLDRMCCLAAIDLMNIEDSPLICDANHPLISNCLKDEMLLYHIDTQSEALLLDSYADLSGKRIDKGYRLDQLSGGQKVLLMLCLALHCPATTLYLKDLYHSLDDSRWQAVQNAVESSSKRIIWEQTPC